MARAELKTFKYDQFAANIVDAAAQITGVSLSVQPGFAQGEAYGQVYLPDPQDYPLKIKGIDLVLASPPNLPGATTHARIEIWNEESAGAGPSGASPLFSITTSDLFNPTTGALGLPLTGNTAMVIDFDEADPANAPPLITSGRIWVIVRFTQPAESLFAEWGTAQCLAIPGIGACGCQKVGVLVDQAPSKNANVIHHLAPLGTCSGEANAWQYAELMGVTGDFVMRMRADVSSGGCVPNCTGKICGSDGCGGSCGSCAPGSTCTAIGTCDAPVCTPDCTGKVCGPNGCGGLCGTCGAGEQCTAAGQCTEMCSPNCAGKECGPDGCGGSCGSCTGDQQCEGGQCTAQCAVDCVDRECGPDGCGGSCGNCAAGESCDDGVCEPPACAPACTGKQCGDDGCGGSCGSCGAGESCSATGACVAEESEFEVTAISPTFGYNDTETNVSITGKGFVPGMTVRLGGTNLSAVQTTGSGLVSATVPAGLEAGMYMLLLIAPDTRTASLADAFEVRTRAAAPSCGDTTCDNNETCQSCPSDCGECLPIGGNPDEGGGNPAEGGGGGAGAGGTGESSGGCRASGGQRFGHGTGLAALALLALVAVRRRVGG